jgi:HAD superfamily hydrolase (TIGR01509 family)
MALSAVIFDVDGTLIDSNGAHVLAWDAALKANHYQVSRDRIAVEIGKGGDKLVPSILGEEIDRRDGEKLREAHHAEYVKIIQVSRLKAFAGVERLVEQIRGLGLKVAIATSSKRKELEITQKSAGVDWSGKFDVVATGDDAEQSKPAPGILQVAIQKLGIAPPQCVMVGDTPYDADTARDAGTISLGVLCGGMNDEKTLRSTGMRKVYRDPAEIAEHLDEALRISSPPSVVIDQKLIDSLMDEALAMAERGMDKGELPIGCVIAGGDGKILARGHNELNTTQNKVAHAEMVTFWNLAGRVKVDARDLILVSTLEPCVMCLGAAMEAAVDTILYALDAPTDGGKTRARPPVSVDTQMPRLLGGVGAEKSKALFEAFLRRGGGNPMQGKFVAEMLAALK